MKITVLGMHEGKFDKCYSYLIDGLDNFNIRDIALSGQAFRFLEQGGEPYTVDSNSEFISVVCEDKYLEIYQSSALTSSTSIELACFPEHLDFWLHYLDIIDNDGNEVVAYQDLSLRIIHSDDEPLKRAWTDCSGIRILNQSYFETALSFITSCANNIPRIQKLMNSFCKCYGDFITTKIDDYEVSYWTFPDVKRFYDYFFKLGDKINSKNNRGVLEQELRQLGFGFRAPNIISLLEFYIGTHGEESGLDSIQKLVRGVGPKVEDCIRLYAFHDLNRIPMDVWMKRFQDELYDGTFPWEQFSPYLGICQQYTYYYYRRIWKDDEFNRNDGKQK